MTWMAVTTLLLLASFVGSAAAQSGESRDRDSPVRITSGEISGQIAPGRDAFYTFVAGPGEVVMTLDIDNVSSGRISTSVDISLFDREAKLIGVQHWFSAGAVRNDRQIKRINITRRQQVLMKISTGADENLRGEFRLRLTGAVELGQPASPSRAPEHETLFVLPARGAMQVEMNDGTVQQISLSEVRRVTVRQ